MNMLMRESGSLLELSDFIGRIQGRGEDLNSPI